MHSARGGSLQRDRRTARQVSWRELAARARAFNADARTNAGGSEVIKAAASGKKKKFGQKKIIMATGH